VSAEGQITWTGRSLSRTWVTTSAVPPWARAAARQAALRASVYLGNSGKLGRQLKWANDARARWAVIYGNAEEEAVTVRDMATGDQAAVPLSGLSDYLADLAARAAD